jgi:GxxExxY protein
MFASIVHHARRRSKVAGEKCAAKAQRSAKEDAKVMLDRTSGYNGFMAEDGSWHSFREPDEGTNQLASAVIGAAIEVHRRLGPGHKESIYKAAMCHELGIRCIPFECEVQIQVSYKDKVVGMGQLDLVVGKRVVVELKAVELLAPVHTSQAISYLRLSGLTLAILINFNVPFLKEGLKRVVLT